MSACVYIIQADNGEIKVGLSGTPYARLSKVKKEYSKRRGFADAYLVGFITTDYGLEIESFSHKFLEQYAVGGEWYKVNSLFAMRAVLDAASIFENDVIFKTVGPSGADKSTVKAFRNLVRERIGRYKK